MEWSLFHLKKNIYLYKNNIQIPKPNSFSFHRFFNYFFYELSYYLHVKAKQHFKCKHHNKVAKSEWKVVLKTHRFIPQLCVKTGSALLYNISTFWNSYDLISFACFYELLGPKYSISFWEPLWKWCISKILFTVLNLWFNLLLINDNL